MHPSRDPDVFDVRFAVRSVRDAVAHHRRVVLAAVVLTLGVALVYAWLWPPIWRAEATVFVERDNDTTRDAFYATWNMFRKDDARTEIELMTSGSVLKKVIEKEHLRYADVYHPFLSHTRHLWESSPPGRLYKSIKGVFTPSDPAAPSAAEVELGKTIRDLTAGISIKPVGDSNVGKMTVLGPSRRVAAIANTLLDVYLTDRAERYRLEAERASSILSEEVARSEEKLREIAGRRLAFVEKKKLTFDFQKEMLELKQLTDLDGEIAKTRAKAAMLEASIARIEEELETEPKMQRVGSVSELNSIREAGKIKRLELQLALAQGEGRYRPDSPEMQDIKKELARVEALIAQNPETVEKNTSEGINAVHQMLDQTRKSLLSELSGTRAGLEVMESTASRLRGGLSGVPSWQQMLRDLDREYGLAQEVYQALVMKRAQALVSLSTSRAVMPSMRIVDRATVPGSRLWPSAKILYPAALLLGLGLGVVAAVLASWIEGRVRPADVESGRTGLPLYGTVVASAGRPSLRVFTGGAD